MKLIIDQRWHGDHGIGRFSRGVTGRITAPHTGVPGDHRSIFSMADPLRLDILLQGRDTFYYTPGYNGPLIRSSRSAITVHDLMHVKFGQYRGMRNNLYYRAIVRRCVRSAPVVFTVSEFTRRELAEWADISEEKIVVLHNGVESRYRPNSNPSTGSPYFLYVGNHKPHKNIPRLLKAFSRSRVKDDVRLFLTGKPAQEESEIIEIEKLGSKVVYLGFVEEDRLPELYANAMALVLPSLYEGFGLPALEAMACGIPVAVSNSTSLPEVVGEAGILFDPVEVDEISTALDRLATDASLRDQLGLAGRQRAALFTWDKSARKLDAALRFLVGE